MNTVTQTQQHDARIPCIKRLNNVQQIKERCQKIISVIINSAYLHRAKRNASLQKSEARSQTHTETAETEDTTRR